jgi:anti-anti-sigma factor
VSGEIDLSNAAALEGEILRHASDAGAVALDLSALTFMDSAGVALLQRLARAIRERGRSLRLVAPGASPVGRLVTLTRLEALIPRDESLDDALQELG